VCELRRTFFKLDFLLHGQWSGRRRRKISTAVVDYGFQGAETDSIDRIHLLLPPPVQVMTLQTLFALAV
jgi:hypothetical protein